MKVFGLFLATVAAVLGGGGDGRGADAIEAGAGADRNRARDGRADRIDCGFGRDTVVSRDRADRLTGCERVAPS